MVSSAFCSAVDAFISCFLIYLIAFYSLKCSLTAPWQETLDSTPLVSPTLTKLESTSTGFVRPKSSMHALPCLLLPVSFKSIDKLVQKERISATKAEETMNSITFTTDIAELQDADFIVEVGCCE